MDCPMNTATPSPVHVELVREFEDAVRQRAFHPLAKAPLDAVVKARFAVLDAFGALAHLALAAPAPQVPDEDVRNDQLEAWWAVCAVLNEVIPDWSDDDFQSAPNSAVAAIRALAAPQPTPAPAEAEVRNRTSEAQGQPVEAPHPKDATEIRRFIGSNFGSEQRANCSSDSFAEFQSAEPSDNDRYELTAHDLLTCFREWSRYEIPVEVAAPVAPSDKDFVLVPRDLLGAACSAIDKKRDAPVLLEKLRAITFGAAPVAPTDERQQFENYVHGTLKMPCQRDSDGNYIALDTRTSWHVWLAALTAAQPEPITDAQIDGLMTGDWRARRWEFQDDARAFARRALKLQAGGSAS